MEAVIPIDRCLAVSGCCGFDAHHGYKMFLLIFIKMKTIKDYLFMFMAWVVIALLCSPVLLIFTVGKDGAPTVWNLVGIGWLAMLILACRKIFKTK